MVLVTYFDGYIKEFKSIDYIEYPSDVKKLNFAWSKDLASIEDLCDYENLEFLNCSKNKLTTLAGIQHFKNLCFLDCSDNELTDLLDLSDLENLKELYCSNNRLRSLEGLEGCSKLQKIHCDHNQLSSLSGLIGPYRLSLLILDCSHNELTSLDGIEYCRGLDILNCSNNKLTTLDGLQACKYLVNVDFSDNRITSLYPIYHHRYLKIINDNDNPIEMTAQVIRFVERIRNGIGAMGLQVYNDNQNVHNSNLQRTVNNSIRNLLKDDLDIDLQECLDEIKGCMPADYVADIEEWCSETDVHSSLNVTYSDLFLYVWNRIRKSEHKSELIEILKQNIDSSTYYDFNAPNQEQPVRAGAVCFTGKLNKLLNTLCGFFDDIQIGISDKEQANNVLHMLVKKYFDENDQKSWPSRTGLLKKELVKELEEREFGRSLIDEYLQMVDQLI